MLFSSHFPVLGAICGRYQVSRHASYETLPRHGAAVWRRKDGGSTSSAIRNSQVKQLSFRGSVVTYIRALASHSYQPSPFFVLDEVDAALDNTNVAKVANYIRAHASETFQFIIISLKGSLYERGHSLVGIYRDQDMNSSRTLTLDVSFSLGTLSGLLADNHHSSRNMTSNIVFILQLLFPVLCALSLVPVWVCPAFCSITIL